VETRCRGSAPDAEESPEVDGSSVRKRERVERREGKVPGEQEGDGDIATLVTGPTEGRIRKLRLSSVAAVGERSSEGQERTTGKRTRTPRKRGEPHGRQPGATNRHDAGGENRRGGGKPRGRNTIGAGRSGPKVSERKREPTGSGLLHRVRRRGSLETPREEVRCAGIEPQGPGRAGKEGTKVRREDSIQLKKLDRPRDDVRVQPTPMRESAAGRKADVETASQHAVTSLGCFPIPTRPAVQAPRR